MFSRHKCGLTVFGDIDVVKNAAGYKPKSGRVDQYDEETHTRKFVSVKDIEKCHDWFVERGRVGETRQQLEAKDKKRKEDEEARKNKPAPTKGGGAKNKGPKGTKGSKGKPRRR